MSVLEQKTNKNPRISGIYLPNELAKEKLVSFPFMCQNSVEG